jgi:hypothetical protein
VLLHEAVSGSAPTVLPAEACILSSRRRRRRGSAETAKPNNGMAGAFTAACAVCLLAWLAYSGLLTEGRLRTGSRSDNYFSSLSVSMAHGRLDIDAKKGQCAHDLAEYNGKCFLYWPPVPAIVYMAFTAAAGGTGTPDRLINAAFGAVNAGLFAFLVFLLLRRHGCPHGKLLIFMVGVFWAFGTVHFYMSMVGSVWFVSQIMGQTFLLVSLLVLTFPASSLRLLLSGVFYGLAIHTRNDLVFAGILHAAFYLDGLRNGWSRSAVVKDLSLFLAVPAALTALYAAYNAARFGGSFWENGIRYHHMAPHFIQSYGQHGFLSFHYLPYNIYTEVIKPFIFSPQFPFFTGEAEGFGFLWVSPVFIVVFPLLYVFATSFRGARDRADPGLAGVLTAKDQVVMGAALASSILVALIIFSIMGTGWIQFGARYTLDFCAPLAMFCLFGFKVWRSRFFRAVMAVLLAISIWVNYFGMRMCLNLL